MEALPVHACYRGYRAGEGILKVIVIMPLAFLSFGAECALGIIGPKAVPYLGIKLDFYRRLGLACDTLG
jgi:hypothetical protein